MIEASTWIVLDRFGSVGRAFSSVNALLTTSVDRPGAASQSNARPTPPVMDRDRRHRLGQRGGIGRELVGHPELVEDVDPGARQVAPSQPLAGIDGQELGGQPEIPKFDHGRVINRLPRRVVESGQGEPRGRSRQVDGGDVCSSSS